MTAHRPPTRTTIIDALAKALEPLEPVIAFWEGGAVSWRRIDEWSDLDLYVVAADASIDGTVRAIDDTLASLSPIRIRYPEPHHPDAGIVKVFYRLEDAGPFLLVDVAVLSESAKEKYLEPRVHGPTDFIFNKGGAVQIPTLDQDAFARRLRERFGRLRVRMDLFEPFLEKERNRGHPLEVLELYQTLILGSLVEVLRMRHGPFHYDFRTRYVYYELPTEVVRRLEDLAFVRDATDLEAKAKDARAWLDELVTATDLDEIESRIRRG